MDDHIDNPPTLSYARPEERYVRTRGNFVLGIIGIVFYAILMLPFLIGIYASLYTGTMRNTEGAIGCAIPPALFMWRLGMSVLQLIRNRPAKERWSSQPDSV